MLASKVRPQKMMFSTGSATENLADWQASMILKAMSDEFSRRILSCVVSGGKCVQEISAETNIPLSTTYRRIDELRERCLVIRERIVLTGTGRRYSIYRSAFSGVRLGLELSCFRTKKRQGDDAIDVSYWMWGISGNEPRKSPEDIL